MESPIEYLIENGEMSQKSLTYTLPYTLPYFLNYNSFKR